jgi:hypothetical protein
MSAISEREKAFENRFAHDEELKFKAFSRRNRLAGLWAAALIGRADADAYASEVVMADFEEVGHEDVLRKLRRDFELAGVSMSDADLGAKMAELLIEAANQVENQ